MITNTLGSEQASRSTRNTVWLWPFAPMSFAAFSLSALVYFHLRQNVFEVRSPLQHLYAALYRSIGFAPAVMFFGLVVLWSTIWLAHGRLERPWQRLGRLGAMTVMLGVLLNLGDGGVSPALHKGAIGAWIAEAMVGAVGYWPSLVLVWAVTFASLLLATDFFFHESFERMLAPASESDDAPERGVEPAVADHLRATSAVAGYAVAGAVGVVAPAADDADAALLPRRRSYHERRAEREAMAARWTDAASDAAAPMLPTDAPVDALSAARVVAAIQAAEDVDATATSAEVAAALDGGGEAVVDDAGAPSSAADVDAAARTPIVFPDEVESPAPAADEARADAPAEAAVDGAPVADDGWPVPVACADEPRAEGGDGDAAESVDAATTWPTASTEEWFASDEVVVLAEAEDADAVAAVDFDRDGAEDALASGAPVDEAMDPREPAATEPEAAPSRFAAAAAAAADAGDAPSAGGGDEAAMAGEVDAPRAAEAAPVAIPRPEPAPASSGAGPDESLMREAIELVTSSRRANAVFLQRKLRVDYDLAAAVLVELAARGVVALDAEATHGRVLV